MNERGFTLVEVLVVASITVMITGLLVVNFSRSRTDLNQIAIVITDAVREAQLLTLSGSLIQGTYRCGYGIHFTADSYLIYAGPNADDVDCSLENRNYEVGTDAIVRQALLSNPALEIAPVPADVFFEPPNPTTYIDDSDAPGANTNINIRRKGSACPGPDCRTINVTTSGRIQLQ